MKLSIYSTMRLGILVCWLLWIFCYDCSYAKTVSFGPVQLFRRKHGFKWEASVDREAGIASSMEVSSRRLRDEKEFPVKQIFHSYPMWLCRFPVSLGLLRSVRKDGGVCVQDRIFRRDLLIFGPAKSRLVSIVLHEGAVQNTYSMELPITGGLLSIQAPRAALLFTLNSIHGKETRTSEIVTRISGYRPSLIGQPPVSNIRTALYFSSQSLIHAGIMWRFHGYCWSKRRAI